MKNSIFTVILATSFLAFSSLSIAQTSPASNPTSTPQGAGNSTTDSAPPEIFVNVQAKQSDVRDVIHDLFDQAKQNYVIDPNVHYVLWLNLTHVDFEQALSIICHEAHLKYEKRDGIWYVSVQPTPAMIEAQKITTQTEEAKLPPTPHFTDRYLAKRVTTRLKHQPIRIVFASLSRQAGIPIFVDAKIPNYKVDAYLMKTSLKYALLKLDEAAGLKYKLGNDGIHVFLFNPLPGVTLDH